MWPFLGASALLALLTLLLVGERVFERDRLARRSRRRVASRDQAKLP